GERDGDVPRTRADPRLPRRGAAAAANLSVLAHLGRRLRHRRGGVLAGDPPSGGRAAPPHDHLRHRHERGHAGGGEARLVPGGAHAALRGGLRARRRPALAGRPLFGYRTQRAPGPEAAGNHHLGHPQPGDRRIVLRLPRDRLRQRPDLFPGVAAGARAPALLRQPRPRRLSRSWQAGVFAALPGPRALRAGTERGQPVSKDEMVTKTRRGARESAQPETLTAKAKVKLLVVADDATKRSALRTILSPLDEDIVGAPSGADALRQLLRNEFAVVLL